MTQKFEKAFKEVLLIEGGISNNVYDKGGLTKYGISQRSFPKEDIRNLTIERAKYLYHENFWKTKRLDMDLIDEKNAIELFDTAVNMGVAVAPQLLQKAINLMNRGGKDLVIDGYVGSGTLEAYSKTDKAILFKVLNGLQFSRYVSIVERNPTQKVFFNGWMKRV